MELIRKRTEKLVQTSIDEEILMMRMQDGEQFSLKGTGEQVWRLIDGARDGDQIVAEVARIYAVEPEAIADDVNALLADLESEELIEVR
jgi:pyrroloquinoline quinone biosynthesis protein D